jgi:hypothetical protein
MHPDIEPRNAASTLLELSSKLIVFIGDRDLFGSDSDRISAISLGSTYCQSERTGKSERVLVKSIRES